MTDKFSDNTHASRFELEVDDKLAHARYKREPGRISLLYVEAEPALRGTGAAGRLMKEIVSVAESEGRKIHPVCSYAVAWMKRNRPELVV